MRAMLGLHKMQSLMKQVASTLGWFEVPWQVGCQLHVEDAHLIGSSVGHDHLSRGGQLPVTQLAGHPVSNVAGVVTVVERNTT